MEPLDSKCLDEIVLILGKYCFDAGDCWIKIISDLRKLDKNSDEFFEKASSGIIWGALLDQFLNTELKNTTVEERLEDERKFRVELVKLGEYLLQFQHRSPQVAIRIYNRNLIQHTLCRLRHEGVLLA